MEWFITWPQQTLSKVREDHSPQGMGQERCREVGNPLVCAAHPGTFRLCRCTQAGRVRSLEHPSGSG